MDKITLKILTLIISLVALSSCGDGGNTGPTPIQNTAPELDDLIEFTVDENTTGVNKFQAIDTEGDLITYSISGVDASLLSIESISGDLVFQSPPDYEYPLDNDSNNIYSVTVSASDGNLSSSIEIIISINNTDDSPIFESPSVLRKTWEIFLSDEDVVKAGNMSFEIDFYRNPAYQAGLSIPTAPQYYTFIVVSPEGSANAYAPLWVYLHGGAQGYFDENGKYQSRNNLNEYSWNTEESFDQLKSGLAARAYPNNEFLDNTLARRIQEGYRILFVSYSDHDRYSGIGTTYPNNPYNPEAKVNGLQATMSAIDYTSQNYPTSYVWVHGTSAGSSGAWSVALAYSQEDKPVTGMVGDSGGAFEGDRELIDAYLSTGELGFDLNWRPDGLAEKVGFFGSFENNFHPEAQIELYDFRASPSIWIVGLLDSYFGSKLDPIEAAIAAEIDSNPEYVINGLRNSILNQIDSPHEVHLISDASHVPTIGWNDPAKELVDDFINKVLASNPPYFGM